MGQVIFNGIKIRYTLIIQYEVRICEMFLK